MTFEQCQEWLMIHGAGGVLEAYVEGKITAIEYFQLEIAIKVIWGDGKPAMPVGILTQKRINKGRERLATNKQG